MYIYIYKYACMYVYICRGAHRHIVTLQCHMPLANHIRLVSDTSFKQVRINAFAQLRDEFPKSEVF